MLVSVAKEAERQLRESDVLMRYGGAEFICILPGATLEGTKEVSERIRRVVAELVVHDCDQAVSCTVSLGYTSFPMARAEDETTLIKIVDDALYRAKAAGRNRSIKGTGTL